MNCDRCGQPLGFVSFVVSVYVNDDEVGQATICSNCGNFIGQARITPPRELER